MLFLPDRTAAGLFFQGNACFLFILNVRAVKLQKPPRSRFFPFQFRIQNYAGLD